VRGKSSLTETPEFAGNIKYPHLKFASVGNVTGLDTSIFDTVHGFVKGVDIGKIYSNYKYFFMSSLFEGFPAPPLEAMATGAVCILSRTAGVNEYGVDGENCLLFEPANSSEAILKFTDALENARLSESISKNAPKTASKYSWSSSTQKLLSLIQEGGLDGLARHNK
jgi:glycosyltransferase involved in cell wall biosynthesis